ncbi:beta-barrel assembly complex subunit BamF [Novosphingobium sp. PhB57]|jgi:hypothetical protein|uniref:DUF3035 domain-containing protein n=1 Tax=unclassified Novosphingobium TaxID=2644732 RepID=UPI0010503F92|nr:MULTISPECIES: DUF3035 domain-containing protein [unclassified Novosphingobium]TCU59435.1 beta-barrel assembly complex subunit BamF [Novosphingobium sp. PhB57]TDW63912.1 beta-barrel assembly complex subunit BamF [Novosphingobium sp. PhB55]
MPMKKTGALILVAAGAVLVSGCGSSGLLNHNRPDEFAVQRQSPLVVPPDFSLAPPKQGQPRPNDDNLQQQTLDALFGGPQARSEIEKSTLSMAGPAAPSIRSTVGDPGTYTVAKGQVTRAILAAPEGDGRDAQTTIEG